VDGAQHLLQSLAGSWRPVVNAIGPRRGKHWMAVET